LLLTVMISFKSCKRLVPRRHKINAIIVTSLCAINAVVDSEIESRLHKYSTNTHQHFPAFGQIRGVKYWLVKDVY